MKRLRYCWWLVLLVAFMLPTTTEAQVIYVNGVAYAPVNSYHGIPAAPGPVANGSVRHYNNGYVGVNARHYSRIPMKWGTGPTRSTGPIVTYPGYGGGCAYPAPYRGGYVHGGVGTGGGYIQGGYAGRGWYVQGGVAFR